MSIATLYRHTKKYQDLNVFCPECREEMTLKHFHRIHAPQRHEINSNRQCAFCFGLYEWGKGEKLHANVTNHMVECLKRFVHVNTIREPKEQEPPLDSSVVLCECRHFRSQPRQMAGRIRDRTSEYIGFYNAVFEKPDMWTGQTTRRAIRPTTRPTTRQTTRRAIRPTTRPGVCFDPRSGLDSDVYWIIQRFLQNNLRWYQLMIKHNAFETFVREMEPIQERIVVLPFWCLCDGLKNDEGDKISHRHMIVACDDSGLFERVWAEKVRLSGEKAKTSRKITTPFHLVRTIAYVSNPKASCDKGIPEDDADTQHRDYSHFHINRPISKHAIVFLCTLYPNGIRDLCVEQFRNRRVVDWEEHVVLVRNLQMNYNKKWAVPMKHTGFKFLNCVIPVKKDLEPSEEETNRHVYLNAETKLYFKENQQLVDLAHEDWIAHQARKGNTLRAIENELYFYTAKQQNVMNQIKQMEERTRDRDDTRWEAILFQLRDENNKLNARVENLEKTLDELRKENNEFMTRNADLQAKLNVALSEKIALEKDKVLKLKWNASHVNFEFES